MTEVLHVSKPVAPPWNDSGKNLVRDLVAHATGVRHRVLTTEGHESPHEHVSQDAIYGPAADFSPSLAQNLRVLARLIRPDRQSIYHFYFAPNPRTSTAARWITRLKRRPTVQTVMSVPASFENVDRLLFADRIVVLSEHTATRLAEAGVTGVVHIPPGIAPPPPYAAEDRRRLRSEFDFDTERPVVVFPGDFEFSEAAPTFAGAIERIAAETDATFVYACRIKRPASLAIRDEIRRRLSDLEQAGRVRFIGETPRIRELLAAADVVTLPSDSTYAKMDIPLVLLEALAESRPVVVADVAPLREVLGTDSCAPDTPVGLAVTPKDPASLGDALLRLLRDPTLREQMGAAGPGWVERRFHAREMGAAHVALYGELLATRR